MWGLNGRTIATKDEAPDMLFKKKKKKILLLFQFDAWMFYIYVCVSNK